MTDATQHTDTTAALADWGAPIRDHARRIAETRPANKAALFDALGRAGITLVTVTFDGYGDSGQIEGIDAFVGDDAVALPSDPIEVAEAVYGGEEIEYSTVTPREAIEKLAYDCLEDSHCGWENGDGAYGAFTFDVAKRTITLAYNERRMETDYYEHVY